MICVKDLSVCIGDFAFKGVQLQVPEGGYGVLMGKTGSGKTTLLESIAGLKPIRQGRIELGGRTVTHMRPAERGIGYVPQDGALFATMTVYQNLAFALVVRRTRRQNVERRIDEIAGLLRISDLLQRKPAGLSGGERQRVALGRALSFEPAVLLLDEPLSALDDDTRYQMYDVIRRVREHTRVTTLHVTHNRHEASEMADVLFQMTDGGVSEVRGGPEAISNRIENLGG
ncbi:MAG: ABC transporter ATP-binding protein [Planctomycetaceae bacterium]|nr:ABC transporter ATP-binding protein [Planctomycetaceae bacterium]MBP61863.1 ABC transporter ATP-binding protein [Planctomycetaceae bacterium]